MAIKISRVGAGDIGVQRTATPAIRTPVDFGAAADSLVRLGSTIGEASDRLFQTGRQIQSREEGREAQEAITSLKKFGQNLQYGEEGYLKQQGADAVTGAAKVREAYEEERQRLLGGFTNQRSQELFGPSSEAEGLQYSQTHNAWVLKQQQVAENRADAADITVNADQMTAEPDPLSPIAQQHNLVRKNAIIAATLRMADRAGVKDPHFRMLMIKKELLKVHTKIVERLMDEGRGAEAKEYLEKARALDEVDINTAAKLGKEVTKSVDLQLAQTAVSQISRALSDKTSLERMEALEATLKDNPEALKEAQRQMRLHNADRERQRKETDRKLRGSARQKVHAGQPTAALTRDENEVIDRTPGMRATLQRLEARLKSGRPVQSDAGVLGDVMNMARNDPEKFMTLDLSQPPYVEGIDQRDWERITGQQLSMDKTAAREATVAQSKIDQGARVARARSATSRMMKSLKLRNKEAGQLDDAMANEIQRRADRGDKLNDTDYQDILRGLLLGGEIRVEGDFFQPDIRLFEELALGTRRFDARVSGVSEEEALAEFRDRNEEFIDRIQGELGGSESKEVVAKVSQALARAGRVPTPFTVKRLIELQRGKTLKKKVVSEPAVSNVKDVSSLWGDVYQTSNSPVKNAKFIANVARYAPTADKETVSLIQDTVDLVFAGDEGTSSATLQEVMVMIALHESAGFKFRKQKGGGPARGIHQVEPSTALSLLKNAKVLFGPEAKKVLRENGLDITKNVTKAQMGEMLQNDVISTVFATAKMLNATKAKGRLSALGGK